MGKYEKYSDEFKKEAVRVLEPKTTIEKELGITHGLLGRWQKRFRSNEETDELEWSEVEQLQMNVARIVNARKVWRRAGEHPPE